MRGKAGFCLTRFIRFNISVLKSIAANHGKSVAQVVIRWVFDFELSQQEMLEIASMKSDRIGADPDTCDF